MNTQDIENDLLGNYTVSKAAKILGITPDGVRYRIDKGQLPTLARGSRYQLRKVVVRAAAECLIPEDLFAMDRQLADGADAAEVLAYWMKHGRRQREPTSNQTAVAAIKRASRERSKKKSARGAA